MACLIIGIDEVGRGALAGPVVLAAVSVQGRIRWTHPELGRIRDSKKLTPKMRERWYTYLTKHPLLQWRVTRVTPRIIDRINISQAANRGATRLVMQFVPTVSRDSDLSRSRRRDRSVGATTAAFVWLDGGLSLSCPVPYKALIRGDERKPIIAAASIIAKVWRDRAMKRMSRRIPNYGFEVHKGYGTKLHLSMLSRFGPSSVHRSTFAPVSLRTEGAPGMV